MSARRGQASRGNADQQPMPTWVVFLIVAAMLWFCLPAAPVVFWPLIIGGAVVGAFSVSRTPRTPRRH